MVCSACRRSVAAGGGAEVATESGRDFREQRDHRPLTRAPQARSHHLSVSRARPVWLTWTWELPKTRSIILSLTTGTNVRMMQ